MALISASGNIGRDGELKTTPSGTSVLTFSVGSKHGFGDKATTTWFECEVWGKFGEAIADRVQKGAKISFGGEFWVDQWDGQNGEKRQTAKVRIIEVDIQNKSENSGGGYSDPPPQEPFGGAIGTGEDVPFSPSY